MSQCHGESACGKTGCWHFSLWLAAMVLWRQSADQHECYHGKDAHPSLSPRLLDHRTPNAKWLDERTQECLTRMQTHPPVTVARSHCRVPYLCLLFLKGKALAGNVPSVPAAAGTAASLNFQHWRTRFLVLAQTAVVSNLIKRSRDGRIPKFQKLNLTTWLLMSYLSEFYIKTPHLMRQWNTFLNASSNQRVTIGAREVLYHALCRCPRGIYHPNV